jgi:hypothetical protein
MRRHEAENHLEIPHTLSSGAAVFPSLGHRVGSTCARLGEQQRGRAGTTFMPDLARAKMANGGGENGWLRGLRRAGEVGAIERNRRIWWKFQFRWKMVVVWAECGVGWSTGAWYGTDAAWVWNDDSIVYIIYIYIWWHYLSHRVINQGFINWT